MSVCTFGLYELYYFYKNWHFIRERTRSSIKPFWRALFSPIWAYSFFKSIRDHASEERRPDTLHVGMLTAAYLIILFLYKLPDPFWVISAFTFVPLLKANEIAVELNKSMVLDYQENDRFSGKNWVAIIIGGTLFAFIVWDMFFPISAISSID